jgi:hypothetical protein
MIEPAAGPMTAQQTQESSNTSNTSNTSNQSTPSDTQLSISYQNFIAPAILVVIVSSAFMYARSVSQLRYNISNLTE